MTTWTKILVRGIVQGVGFRPYVYSLAKKRELRGSVANNGSGVVIVVEGDDSNVDLFVAELENSPPPLSKIDSVTHKTLQSNVLFGDFRILPSKTNGSRRIPVSADISTCAECLAEMFDPTNRRYRYPFINCTNCGPRFTIIESVPYDRVRTTMREFEMCNACRVEYENPLDRRFHAEPTACPACGPQITLTSVTGDIETTDVVDRTRDLLKSGKIVAIKGLGGFHLACDALNDEAVARLRRRKYREDKPFALMAGSIAVVGQYCEISADEAGLLDSRERPVVLLSKRSNVGIAAAVAPKLETLGFMLPYTPLHYLLFEGLDAPLVMTSGNVSDEPICYRDDEAASRLDNIAEHYLINDRQIYMRTDDTVVRVLKSEHGRDGVVRTCFLRRSRGYAPAPVKTSFRFDKQVLACGGELKNTFCLTRDNDVFVSHHIGDLENLETLRSFTDGIEHYKRLFDLHPEVIAYDLHPDYLSTKYAHSCDGSYTKIGVQHHHAHIASCLADNNAEGEVIGVAMDGLGYGSDNRMWGGEFFIADLRTAERVAHLAYVPMPGGSKAIREPWRMAAVYVQKTFGPEFLELDIPFVSTLDRGKWSGIASMIASRTNCPETSSMGRLFDAVSALLGVRGSVNYEGQAAIEMEAIADKNETTCYEFEVAGDGVIDGGRVIRSAVEDLLDGEGSAVVAARFHNAVAGLIADIAVEQRDRRKVERVALSGGVFQNMLLLERTCRLLSERGFETLTHRRVPTNDGGLSLGQAAIANARILSGRT